MEASRSRSRQIVVSVGTVILCLALLGGIIYVITGKGQTLELLAQAAIARGLITFVFALGTIAIAVLLTFYALLGQANDWSDRFSQGKEVLIILIGVLGTIVGFYFGTTDESMSTSPAEELAIVSTEIAEAQPAFGGTITVVTAVRGGTAPYTYSLIFEPSAITPIKEHTSKDALFIESVAVPGKSDFPMAAEGQAATVTWEITVKDSKDQTTSGTSSVPLEPK